MAYDLCTCTKEIIDKYHTMCILSNMLPKTVSYSIFEVVSLLKNNF